MPKRIRLAATKAAPGAPPAAPAAPGWLRPVALVLAAVCLLGWFSTEIADPDFWWHLRTGQYIASHRALPVPDPFAYTTAVAKPTSAAEALARQFNLTHEWLAQVLLYAVYRAGSFPSIVLARAAMLACFCALVGLTAYRRRSSFWASMAAAFAAALIAGGFTADRPYQITFLLLALTLALAEWRRGLWLLPPVFLIWANCHGGFFLGWLVLAAHSAEALALRLRGQPAPGARRLWLVSAVCVLVCLANPNGYDIFPVLLEYRSSFLQGRLQDLARLAPRHHPFRARRSGLFLPVSL